MQEGRGVVVCVYVRVWLFEVLGNANWAFTGKLCIAILSLSHRL
jgi:hypothetical protein